MADSDGRKSDAAKFDAAKFDDGKDAGALRTIGEVSEALGIKTHVLRYWEQQFVQLQPLKRSGGRRYYRPSDIAVVETIDRLVNEQGYTLKGAQAVLRSGAATNDRSEAAPADGSGLPIASISAEDTLKQLKDIRQRLARAIER